MTTPAYYEVPESAWMFRDAAAARQVTDAKWSPPRGVCPAMVPSFWDFRPVSFEEIQERMNAVTEPFSEKSDICS